MTPKNQALMPPGMPVVFDDDLAGRCFPHRFRRIGSPYAYLNDVGITAILEFIYKGNLLIDVAEAVNVPLTALRLWVENEDHTRDIDEAETISAEGYLAEGMRRLKNAPTEFELKRAKEMIRHAQYMAGKKNKPTYGEAVNAKPSSDVTYVFNIPNTDTASIISRGIIEHTGAQHNIAPLTPRTAAESALDRANSPERAPVSMDLGEAFGLAVGRIDGGPTLAEAMNHLADTADSEDNPPTPTTPALVLVAARPIHPTAANPDVGPFYNESETPNDD